MPISNACAILKLKGTSSGCHNPKLDKISSYLTIFACPFGRYKYTTLSFGATLAGDTLQRKIDKTFKEMTNVFGIADGI